MKARVIPSRNEWIHSQDVQRYVVYSENEHNIIVGFIIIIVLLKKHK